MTKIIWIIFTILAMLWTALIAVSTQILSWSFSLISSSHINHGMPLEIPLWLQPWVDQNTVNAWQVTVGHIAQWLNGLLPKSTYVGDFLILLTWITWGLVLLVMLMIAAAMHWFAATANVTKKV